MSSDSVKKNDQSLVSIMPTTPSTLSLDDPDSTVEGEKGPKVPKEVDGLKEMEEEDLLSDDDFLSGERTGMAQRIRALGIRPAWWKERKKEKLRRSIRLARAHLNVWDLPLQSTKEPLQLPLDIVACIFSHIPDLETLSDCILINKTFSSIFQAFRLGITREVVGNMFGVDLVEHVLILASMLVHKGPLKDKNGKISLMPPARTTALSASTLREIINVWHTTEVWVGLWETNRLWMSDNPSNLAKREALSEESRIYFVRAIIMFWIYSTCARNTLKHHSRYSDCSMNTLENTGIFDYYSHIELLEARAIFDYFESLVHIACRDSGMDGDDHYLYWQFYCVSLGPLWILKLLDHYDGGFVEAGDGEDEGFFIYHSEAEQEAREIDGMFFGFTDKSIKGIHKQFKGMGVDGVARPINQLAKGVE